MSRLELRAMTQVEAAEYRRRLLVGFAEQQVSFGNYTEDEAHARAQESMARLWPEDGPADGHHTWVAEVGGRTVGRLWLAEETPRSRPGQAWVFDIEIDEAMRGQGLGRELMQAAMDQARALGCTMLGLNVFGGNEVAIGLYESLGFRTQAQQMSITL